MEYPRGVSWAFYTTYAEPVTVQWAPRPRSLSLPQGSVLSIDQLSLPSIGTIWQLSNLFAFELAYLSPILYSI